MLNRCIYVLLLLLLYIFLYISLSNRFGNCSVSNEKILRNLGLKKVKESGDRKSFVARSRTLGSNRDSRIFVVKLPPNANYYMANRPLAGPIAAGSNGSSNSSGGSKAPTTMTMLPGKKPPVMFATNGQPNRIYHWNLPLLQNYQKKLHLKKNQKLQWKKKLLSETVGAAAAAAAAAKNLVAAKTAHLLAAKQAIFVPVRRNKAAATFYRFENSLSGSNGRPHSFYLINPSGQKSAYQKLINGQYDDRGRFY